MVLQIASARKSRRLVAVFPPDLHEAFLCFADSTGESAGMIMRGLVREALERARRGEPIIAGLTADTSTPAEG